MSMSVSVLVSKFNQEDDNKCCILVRLSNLNRFRMEMTGSNLENSRDSNGNNFAPRHFGAKEAAHTLHAWAM